MNNSLRFLAILLLFTACQENKNKENASLKSDYTSYGGEISASLNLDGEDIREKYSNLKPGDTLELSFASKVNSVCKMKGCWMYLDIPGDDEVRVTFKDYEFFVPKDIENREVIVSGKAYLSELSVEDQRHFAEDAGKSEDEIAQITEPKHTKSFLADGVLLKN